MLRLQILLSLILLTQYCQSKTNNAYEICAHNKPHKIYLDFHENGILAGTHVLPNHTENQKCSIEFLTCPSCIIELTFSYLNVTKSCGKETVFDTCGCDYIWIYEPAFEEASGQQFCGQFYENDKSSLNYISQTRTVAITFNYNQQYDHAFTLKFSSERNRINFDGYPQLDYINNSTHQTISSPFFPSNYPTDLSIEYVINCHQPIKKCRISILFTDFLIADSSIIEFFDWNGQRMYVTTGHSFRPPIITSSGPTIVVRFYANGASDFGFKAAYSFILGAGSDLSDFKPNLGCGGHVSNLGGAITMMNMVHNGTKYYDCVWLIKPAGFLHLKTHLYLKLLTLHDFVGNSQLVIRQGLTSLQPYIEKLKTPLSHLSFVKEHVVPISQGFYVSFRGSFQKESQLAIAYAAFNYRDCFAGSDFLCRNMRCISVVLNCDGLNHCGDNSDESSNCSQDSRIYRNHADWSKTPNYIFPKLDQYSDLTAATLIFLTCSLGLIGIIFAMALLLYRVNVRAQHQRQIHDHIETINAILEDSVEDIEEEIIIPDDPPEYEYPPDYTDVVKLEKGLKIIKKKNKKSPQQLPTVSIDQIACTSKSCQTTPIKHPESPPPAYNEQIAPIKLTEDIEEPIRPRIRPTVKRLDSLINPVHFVNDLATSLRENLRKYKSVNILKSARQFISFSEENLVRYFSDSQLHGGGSASCMLMEDRWGKVKYKRVLFKKSFSTDDISFL